MALWRHARALSVWRGDDPECFCRDGGAVVRALVHLSAAASGVAFDWASRNVRLDAHGLSQAPPARCDLSGGLRCFADAGRRVLFGSVPRHASLDPFWPNRNPAFGARQASRDSLSGMVFGPKATRQGSDGVLQRRFSSHHSARVCARPCLRCIDPGAARPGHLSGYPALCHDDSVCRGTFLEVDCYRICRSSARALSAYYAGSISNGAVALVLGSRLRPARCGLPVEAILDCGWFGWTERGGVVVKQV